MGNKNVKKLSKSFIRKRKRKITRHEGMFGYSGFNRQLEGKIRAGDQEAVALLEKNYSTENKSGIVLLPENFNVAGYSPDDPCIFCKESLIQNAEIVKEKAFIALQQCSLEREDELYSTLESLSEVVVHTICRKEYMKTTNIKECKLQKKREKIAEQLAELYNPEIGCLRRVCLKKFSIENFLALVEIDSRKEHFGIKACIFCKQSLSSGEVVTTNPQYVERLKKLSLQVNDDIYSKLQQILEIDVHDVCLKKYENDVKTLKVPAYIEQIEENSPFDHKVQCLLCKKDASDEFVKLEGKKPANLQVLVCELNDKSESRVNEAVKSFPGVWSSQVLHRIKKLKEQKVLGRYHNTCFFSFCFKRPKDEAPGPTPIIKASIAAQKSKKETKPKISKRLAELPVEAQDEIEGPKPPKRKLTIELEAIGPTDLEAPGSSHYTEDFQVPESSHFADDDYDDPDTVDEEDAADEEPDFLCNSCSKGIPNIRYSCVHCPDFDLCDSCTARGQHAFHYMLRIPEGRDREEVDEALQNLRATLIDPAPHVTSETAKQNKVLRPIPKPISQENVGEECLSVLDELKVEVKEEIEESADPLEEIVPDMDNPMRQEYELEITRLIPAPPLRLASLSKTLDSIANLPALYQPPPIRKKTIFLPTLPIKTPTMKTISTMTNTVVRTCVPKRKSTSIDTGSKKLRTQLDDNKTSSGNMTEKGIYIGNRDKAEDPKNKEFDRNLAENPKNKDMDGRLIEDANKDEHVDNSLSKGDESRKEMSENEELICALQGLSQVFGDQGGNQSHQALDDIEELT